MSAFGIGTNTQGINSGKVKGTQKEIACDCWFTSTGKSIPRMIKFIDANDELQTIDKIHVKYTETKNYSGIQSIEYGCTIICQGFSRDVKLIFFKDSCKWIMTFL
jgi:hypothetical protein